MGKYLFDTSRFLLGYLAAYVHEENDAGDDDGSNSSSSSSGRTLLVLLAFLSRMAMMGASCTTWVSTSEILSTDIRATGHGAANAMGRLGGFFAPYIITEGTSLRWIAIFVLLVSFITSVTSWQLPETAGKALGEASPPSSNDEVEATEIGHNDDGATTSHENTTTTTPYHEIL